MQREVRAPKARSARIATGSLARVGKNSPQRSSKSRLALAIVRRCADPTIPRTRLSPKTDKRSPAPRPESARVSALPNVVHCRRSAATVSDAPVEVFGHSRIATSNVERSLLQRRGTARPIVGAVQMRGADCKLKEPDVRRSISWAAGRFTMRLMTELAGDHLTVCGRPPWRGSAAAVAAIKAVHTLAWLAIESSMVSMLYDGVVGRADRRTAIAAGVVAGESVIFVANGCRCPLTQLVEWVGAERGSVTDIYLPGWLAHNLVAIHVPLIALAGYLHARNLQRRR